MRTIRVSVALALPGRQEVIALELPRGSTLAEALAAADLGTRFPEVDAAALRYGIWSRPCALETVLREGDRVEAYRPLVAEPKAARRARARLRSSPRSRSGP